MRVIPPTTSIVWCSFLQFHNFDYGLRLVSRHTLCIWMYWSVFNIVINFLVGPILQKSPEFSTDMGEPAEKLQTKRKSADLADRFNLANHGPVRAMSHVPANQKCEHGILKRCCRLCSPNVSAKQKCGHGILKICCGLRSPNVSAKQKCGHGILKRNCGLCSPNAKPPCGHGKRATVCKDL